MITPIADLKTPEGGQRLENRRGSRPRDDDEQPLARHDSDLAARIAAARDVQDVKPHCRDCFNRGRDAAIAVFESSNGG